MIILAGLAPELKSYTLKIKSRDEKRAGSNDRNTRSNYRNIEKRRGEKYRV